MIRRISIGTTGNCIYFAELWKSFIDNKFNEGDGCLLLTKKDAYKKKILNILEYNAKELSEEDTLMLYFAGHTKKVSCDGTYDNCKCELDGMDEVLCLYESYLTDDDFMDALDEIPATKICVINSCFAGGWPDKIKTRKTPMHFFCSSDEETETWEKDRFTSLFKENIDHVMKNNPRLQVTESKDLLQIMKKAFFMQEKPIYITNQTKEIEMESEMTEMEVPGYKNFTGRNCNTLETYKDVDAAGVMEKLDGVELILRWDMQRHNPSVVKTEYLVTHCHGTKPVHVKFRKATPDDCLDLVKEMLGRLHIKLFGIDNMEIDMDNITIKATGWYKTQYDSEMLENPTKAEFWNTITEYFESLSCELRFKGQAFDFTKIGSIGFDGALSGSG